MVLSRHTTNSQNLARPLELNEPNRNIPEIRNCLIPCGHPANQVQRDEFVCKETVHFLTEDAPVQLTSLLSLGAILINLCSLRVALGMQSIE